jgi:thiamine phosphate synthase YjbQ (UPF0047 family)
VLPSLTEYTGDVEDWRDSEPKNAHAHILSILLSSSLSIPVHEGQLALGAWQSVIMVSPCSITLAQKGRECKTI